MKRKIIVVLLFVLIVISAITSSIFASTGYKPTEDEIAPVDTITTGDKALSEINVRIFQPFFDEMDDTTSDRIDLPAGIISDAQCPVAPVKILQENYGALIKTTRTCNKPITLEDIQSLGPNQIIIFSGHGTWVNEEIHSTILTGARFNEDAYYNDPLYRQDVDEGRIVDDVGNEAITAKYIEKYCPDLNNSFVFLSICQGAYCCDGDDGDQTLVNAFLAKGAKAVVAYSQTTDMRYSNVMIYEIVKELGEGKTLGTALANAKSKYGDEDGSAAHSKPLIFPKDTAKDFSIDSAFNTNAPISRNYVFDGKEKTGVLSGIGYTLSGDLKKTKVGDYTVVATLHPGFKWPDGSTDPKTIDWSITKANVTELDLIPNNIEIKYDTNIHDLLSIRNKDLGTYYFRLKGKNKFSKIIPKAKDVGEYEIEWYFVGEDNINNIGSVSSPITYKTNIVKGTRPEMEARLPDYHYGRYLPIPYLSKTIEKGTKVEYYYFKLGDLSHHYKWENMTSTTLEVGDYYIYAKIAETPNYEAFETFDTAFKVLEYMPMPKPHYKVPNTGVR